MTTKMNDIERYSGQNNETGLTRREEFGASSTTRSAETATSAAAAQAQAITQARFVVALQRPRDIDDVRVRILKECKRPGFAESAIYRKPIGGGNTKEGPSIRFAESAMRCMTNVWTPTVTIYDDATKRVVRVSVTDLEANVSYEKDITIEKTVERSNPSGRTVISSRKNSNGNATYVVAATEDELAIKEAALVSKVIRNNGLRIIPGDIIEEAMRTCRATQRDQDKKDPDAARKRLADAFSDLGVKPSDLKQYLNHELGQSSPAEIEELRGVYAAIKEGETTWQAAVEAKRGEKSDAAKGAAAPSSIKDRVKAKAESTKAQETQQQPATREPGDDAEEDARRAAAIDRGE